MPIQKLTTEVLRTINPMAIAKLNEEFKSYGIHFELGKFFYTREGDTAELRLNLTLLTPKGEVVDRARLDWQKSAEVFDCDPAWLDKTFTVSGKTFKVAGLMPNRPKNCVSIQNVRTGRRHICSPDYVRLYLGVRRPTRSTELSPATPAERREVERQIAEMRSNNPEAYEGDGEHRANGMTEKQIHDMHFNSLLRQLRFGNPLDSLFGSVPVTPAPNKK